MGEIKGEMIFQDTFTGLPHGDYFLILTGTTLFKQKSLTNTLTFAREIDFKIFVRKIMVQTEYKIVAGGKPSFIYLECYLLFFPFSMYKS